MGFKYQINNGLSYSSSLYLTKLQIIGIKFALHFHTVRLSVPINIGVLKIFGKFGVGVTAALMGVSYLGLRYVWDENKGEISRKEDIDKACNELNS